MKKKNITPYFIAMSALAFPLFFLTYNIFSWENDLMYHHKVISIILTIINAVVVFGLFGYMWKNSRHSD